MTKDIKWTYYLLASIFILAIVLDLGLTAGTCFHIYGTLSLVLLTIIVFIYWLVKGLFNKQWFFAFKVFISPFIIIATHYLLNYDRIKLDGKKAELHSFICGENSNYPFAFSHRAFRKIQIGMTKDELIDLLGKPLQIWPYNYQEGKESDTLGYKYCMDDLSTNHRVRIVLLRSDTIISFHNSFYED